ncbi:MAG: TrmH family RNA methyltransferase [Clostridia bacterium]|nr:TrmH family RNA methyltransferase [Clostridia bacterium]NCC42790.1 TrmH family RNA methyltransferase [Clostridia bacterium]
MNRDVPLKKYAKKMEYSYTMGAFPTIELLKNQPQHVLKVLLHPDMNSQTQLDIISGLCKENNIPLERAGKSVEKLRDKENIFAIGVFEKYENTIEPGKNHVVLVNPSDMGNMGTIIRTSIGFGIDNLAIIEPGVDVFNPKVVRASMGSLFQLNFCYFESFEAYAAKAGERKMYPFMLKGAVPLQELRRDKDETFSLIFGNEATGLADSFAEIGQSVVIRHTDHIDSLNLALATGIGIYEFTK